jgi:enoyl-CoA hydratase/carnithine racemase
MANYRYWQLSEDDHIASLSLNRPQAMNSLTAETLYELREVTGYLRGRPDVWAVILEGQGDHFSVGIDLSVIEEMLKVPESAYREGLRSLQQCLDDFEALEKVTVAKLKGFCIGGGLLLALCCDFRIASERTVFSLPEVKLGFAVLMGTQRVTRVAGLAATKELILLGERFGAHKAEAYGLVHRVVPPHQLDEAVAALAGRFRRLPPRTVGIAKRIINEGHTLSLRMSQDLEIDAQAELLAGHDIREAIASFREKRRPEFIGE